MRRRCIRSDDKARRLKQIAFHMRRGDASGQMTKHASWAHVVRRNTANVLKDVLMNYSLAVAGWSSEGTLL